MTFMADSKSDILDENRVLERAIWRKWNKFIWSGFLYIVIGLLIITGGLLLTTNSVLYLIVGLGVIVVLIGDIRLLIGIINPLSPKDLDRIEPPSEEDGEG